MILGIHAPVRNGYGVALEHAKGLKVACFQMLPYRRHSRPDDGELAAFQGELKSSGLRLVCHSRFVPALASSDPARRARSVELLSWEAELSRKLGAEAYILHLGAYSPGETAQKGLENAVESIRRAEPRLPIWIENVPGGGRRLGGSLEELSFVFKALDQAGLAAGLVLDTAHAHAAGYDLSGAEGALKFLAKVHRLLGAEAVKAFHLNDTRALLGSHLESHEHWGGGRLGKECLRVLLERGEYARALGILETPPGKDAENLAFVSRLAAA